MRPLHRPMFRYGGPIKEGVMSGIKEPVRKAALVGNSVYPQTGGREHHNIIKTILGWGAKPVLGAASKKTAQETAKKTVGTETVKGIKSLWQKYKPTWPKATRTAQIGEGKGAFEVGKGFKEIPIPKMERFGRFVKQNPWWTAGGALYGSKPAYELATGPGKGLVKTAADVAVPDWIYNWETGRWFNPDDKDIKPEDKKILDEKITEKVTEKIVPEVPQKTADEIRAERIQKYRDIMDIKGMNKRAAYDSLIDASKLVGESGDFKEDIKSGKLINQIIQATSKAYDKPAKTKDAIDTLILKGEIEKDIKSSMPTEAEKTAAAFGISKEDYAKKLLGKSSPAEIIANISTKTGRVDSTTVASGYKASGIVPKATITDTIIDEWIDDKDGRTAIDYVKEVISKADGFGPGLYVVGDRAVLFDGTNYSYDY